MTKLAKILRLLSLSLLFGGSATVVFVAVILVKAAKAKGIPVEEAAGMNAPAFIEFSKIAAGAAITLIISEAINFMTNTSEKTRLAKSVMTRYISSALCIIATFIFAFGIVPPMKELQPDIHTDSAKAAQFHELHETSRIIFGGTIIFALLSLLLTGLESSAPERKDA